MQEPPESTYFVSTRPNNHVGGNSRDETAPVFRTRLKRDVTLYPARFALMLLLWLVMLGCNPAGSSAPKQLGEIQDQSATGLNPKETGYYEVKGTRTVGATRHTVSNAGLRQGNPTPVQVEWPVAKREFEKFKEGMTLTEVRKVLALDSLKYNPPSNEYRLQFVFKQGSARATLTFSGSPEVKLFSMSSEGLK
jgi:hypothetical protein